MSARVFCHRVLQFWFGNHRWQHEQPPAKATGIEQSDLKRWFSSTKEFDEQVKLNFEQDLTRLMNNEYRYPEDFNQPEDLLACIVALDQFPRNIYRRDPRAFAYDDKAREFSQLLIKNGQDKQLPYVERGFAYLPFEHSENLDDQNTCVKHMQQLIEDASQDPDCKEELLGFLKEFLKASEHHREIIRQFGRFPHRNAILNRVSKENEEVFLTSGGARFGQ